MLDRRLLLAAVVASGCAGPVLAQPAAQGQVRAVLELFTSQGCSSCPPADQLFLKLSREPGVIALSMPVTIWDYLGWKDTLAQPMFTARQKHYGLARGDRHIYTPQAVINGVAHAVGSDFHAIERARAGIREAEGALSMAIGLSRINGQWKLDVPAGAGRGVIWIAPYDRTRTIQVNRGENSGRSVTYANVVRTLVRFADYSGEAKTFDLPSDLQSDAQQGFAILVQAGAERRPGAILGAVDAMRD